MTTEQKRKRMTFPELMIQQRRLLDDWQRAYDDRGADGREGPPTWLMFREAMAALDDALVGWDESNGETREAWSKGFKAGSTADVSPRCWCGQTMRSNGLGWECPVDWNKKHGDIPSSDDDAGLEKVRVLCEAQTVVGPNITRCDLLHTHAGHHHAELPDGRVFTWEPLTSTRRKIDF